VSFSQIKVILFTFSNVLFDPRHVCVHSLVLPQLIRRCTQIIVKRYETRSHIFAFIINPSSINTFFSPGVTVTELHARSGMDAQKYGAFLEHSKGTHPLGRVGTSEECASAIAFLASDASSFTTGASIPVDGGRHAACPR
jgi:hypothetical protein